MKVKINLKGLLFSLVVLFVFGLIVPEDASAEQVQATIPTFAVTVNGAHVAQEQRYFPFLVYKDITYFPMTTVDSTFLGLGAHWEHTKRTLHVFQTDRQFTQFDYAFDRGEHEKGATVTATIAPFNIIVNGQTIQNASEPYPLITYRDITYFPMTWRFGFEEFGWGYSFSTEKGLVIDARRRNHAMKLTKAIYEKVHVGHTTYDELVQIFGQGEEEAYENEVTFNVKEQQVTTYFRFLLSDSLVLAKEIVKQDRQTFPHSYTPSHYTPAVVDSVNYFKIKPGMTLEQVNQIMQDNKYPLVEDMDGASISYYMRQADSRQISMGFHFKRVNGQYIVQPNSSYSSSIYEHDIFGFENTKFTQAVADRIYVGMTYEQLVATTGYQGYLVTEMSSDWQMFNQSFLFGGPNKRPYMLVSLSNNIVVGINTFNIWDYIW